MSSPPRFGFEQLTTEIIRGVLETVAERPGETEAQRFARHQTTVFSVMAFMPRDAVETMLAGQCVIFDHVLRDGARDLLRGQTEELKLRVRPQLVAMGNSFLKALTQLTRLQNRPAERTAVVPTAKAAPPGPRNAGPQEAGPRPSSAAEPQTAHAPAAETQTALAPKPVPENPAHATPKPASLAAEPPANAPARRPIRASGPTRGQVSAAALAAANPLLELVRSTPAQAATAWPRMTGSATTHASMNRAEIPRPELNRHAPAASG